MENDKLVRLSDVIETVENQCSDGNMWGNDDLTLIDARKIIDELSDIPAVDAIPVVRCKDCIYYDLPHVEDGCERYEYSDMPEDAFDSLGTGLVHIGYGVNVGGRCCVDDMKGYSEDKRVFVNESNYCGRAIRKKVTE